MSEDEFLQKAVDVPLQKLTWNLPATKGVEVLIRRDDLIDPYLSGNKFYKLFYNLHAAKRMGHHQLLSFGGAYSNHLYALAAAGFKFGLTTIGVIRGERPKNLSPTLLDAEAWGMKLYFISRKEYSEKTSEELHSRLQSEFGDFYSIPEGGANQLGVKGTKALGSAIGVQLKGDVASVCLACGTGNTLAGVAAGLSDAPEYSANIAIGFSVLKGEGQLGKQIALQQQGIGVTGEWRLISGFHGGGYGKKLPSTFIEFNQKFECETQLKLDPVYTLKMVWGVANLLQQNYWPRGSRLVLIHTGGLQGCRGFRM